MAKKDKHVDNLLDALVWMRRNAKRHEPVDDLIDALIKMRRRVKKKAARRKNATRVKGNARTQQPLKKNQKAAARRPTRRR